MRKRAPASNLEWQQWGEIDPLYAVATWEGTKTSGPNPWTEERFYELGASDWQDFELRWRRYGVSFGTCVEIGCGAGRLTRSMAQSFDRVYGIDVSEGMLRHARKSVSASNALFCLTSGGDLPLRTQSVDAIFSTLVFQHFDSTGLAEGYFAEIGRILRPGGTMMVHLPVYLWPSMTHVFEALHRARKRIGDAKAGLRRSLSRMGIGEPPMRRLTYSIDFLFEVLPGHGLTGVELTIFPVRSNGGLLPFVFARKNGGGSKAPAPPAGTPGRT